VPFGSSIIRLLICSAILLTVGVAARPGALAGPSPGPSPSASPSPSPTGPPQCSDDIDNDGDGSIDFDGGPNGETADPGCDSSEDNSENPFHPSPCGRSLPRKMTSCVHHTRTIRISRLSHVEHSARTSLVVRGNLKTDDGEDLCSSDVPIELQRRSHDDWVKVQLGRTHAGDADQDGDYRFRLTVGDLQGRYRVVAPRHLVTESETSLTPCSRAETTFRHRHGA
jgi:hypothetical protein